MKRRGVFILAVFALVLIAAPAARAESLPAVSGVELPDPGLTPDNSFYFLKKWKEQIQLFFTFGVENKAKQFLRLSEVRLAEYQKMIEKGKTEIAEKTIEKYERQLNQAVEKAQEVEKKDGLDNVMNTIQERKIKHQGILMEVLTKVSEETKQEITEKRSGKWTEFITGVREKFPELISGPVEIKNIPVQVLFGCSVPSVPRPEDCEGGWSLNQSKGCPYFSCPGAIKRPVSEPPTKPAESSVQPPESEVCIQVITPAMDPDGKCKEFGTPCDVPADWKKVEGCPVVSPTLSPTPTPSPTSPLPPAELIIGCCFSDGVCQYETKEQCSAKNGEKVSSCSASSCPAPTSLHPLYNECSPGEKKDYQCPNGTPMPWCACDKTGKWSCAWDEPQIGIFCPFSIAGPPVISRAEVRDPAYDPFSKEVTLPIVKEIIWSTNETADGFVEYGKTTSYGSTTPLASVAEFRRVTHKVKLSGLLSNTTYHFRVIAKDTEGNKIISDDYTFTTGL